MLVDHKNISIYLYNFVKSRNDKNIVCDVKYVAAYANYGTTRSQIAGVAKKAPKGAYFH